FDTLSLRDALPILAECLADALQPGGVIGFEAQHQHRRGIRGPHQSPAIRVVDADAVDGGYPCLLPPVRCAMQGFDQLELALLADADVDFRGAPACRV